MNSIRRKGRVGFHPFKHPYPIESGGREKLNTVELAILKTCAYADIFDYPLAAQEIHFYLIGMEASPETVAVTLALTLKNSRAIREYIEESEGYYSLKGRGAIIETRRSRSTAAARLMPKAFHYGSWIARFPFVRMVALTGALAVGNADPDADIDFLIVTENGRVWTCRALLLPLVRLAALRGDRICPNYYLSERSMKFSERDLYSAHEVAQMIPIAGMETYRRMRALNAWTLDYLPNAVGSYGDVDWRLEIRDWGAMRASDLGGQESEGNRLDPGTEANRHFERLFRLPLFERFERWEMERKIRKFNRTFRPAGGKAAHEAAFSADWCKGHFDGHRQRTLEAYRERIRRLLNE
jgi:hypothetical protein